MTEYNFEYIRKEYERDCLKKLHRDYKRSKPLRVEMIENGVILPRKDTSGTALSHVWMGIGGVIDSKDNFIELSGILGFGKNDGRMVFGGKYQYNEPEEFLDEEVLYMGAFQPHWGHFLLEYCTRLWYYVKYRPNVKIAYCGFFCAPNDISGNYMDFLSLLGVKKEQLVDIRKPTKVRKIIVPEQSFLRDKYITDEYRMIIDFAYQNIEATHMFPYEKIYFTRVNCANAKEHGEREIKEIFEKNGYTCLSPEKLSVEEQMFYIRNCKEFVVFPGGASMNGVFAANSTKRIYLKKAYLPELPGDVFQIDQLTKAEKVVFIDCYFKPYSIFPLGYGEGPHFLGVTKELKKYLKQNGMKQLKNKFYFISLTCNWLWLTNRLLQMVFYKILSIIKHLQKSNGVHSSCN